MFDTNDGLIGAIIISKRGMGDPNTRQPIDVDREFVTLFKIFDENPTNYRSININMFLLNGTGSNITSSPSMLSDPAVFASSNKKHTINGKIYGAVEGLSMKVGERVRWYVAALGNAEDVHTVHWHGQTLVEVGQRVDVSPLLSASTKTLDMVPDNAGTWLFHCHVDHHAHAGMSTLFTVEEDSDDVKSE